MSKEFGAQSKYSVGYGKLPIANRFSATNQPAREPRRMPPWAKKTVIELAREPVRAKQADGSYIELPAEEMLMRSLVAKALGGDMAAA